MSVSSAKRTIKKGEILFQEGQPSSSMYLILSGALRIFKKKAESKIEIATLKPGQILGEMGFLDGSTRSASAEAIIDTELVEISQAIYQATLKQTPEWFTILLKAIVARLRSTTTQLKNLESASTTMDYSDGQGKRTYVFLSAHDSLKISTALLLTASRSQEAAPEGKKAKIKTIERYAKQVMGVPEAKTGTFLEELKKTGIILDGPTPEEVILKDAITLEQYIQFQGEENISEASKRHDITLKGFTILSLLAKNISKFPKESDGQIKMNIAQIIHDEAKTLGREPFQINEFSEMVKLGYAGELDVRSGTEQFSTIHPEKLSRAFRMHWIQRVITQANEEKK